MQKLLRRLLYLLRRNRHDADLREEMETHRSLRQEKLEHEGVSPAAAAHVSRRALGNVTLAREDARDIWIVPALENVWRNVRYGLRGLWRSPGFTLTAIATLAVGVGVTTSVFGLVNGVLLRPWPVADPDRVVVVGPSDGRGIYTMSTPPAAFRFLQDEVRTIDLVAIHDGSLRIDVASAVQNIQSRYVSANYFDVLRLPIALGRGFRAEEGEIGKPVAVAVIAHGLWDRAFGRAPDVIGRVIRLNDVPFTIVGVAGRGATDSSVALPDVWVPLVTIPLVSPDRQQFLVNPEHCCVRLAGRLRDGISRAQASAEINALDAQFRKATDRRGRDYIVTGTAAGAQASSAEVIPVVSLIFAGLLLVIVAASANVGNLQLARAMARRRELAIRCSLGASRRRIVVQLLTEGLLLGAAAAVLSVIGAFFLPDLFVKATGRFSDLNVSVDTRVVLVAVALALFAALASSLAPALRSTRRLALDSHATGGGRLRLRSYLLAVQVAISTVLLIGAALLVRSVLGVATLDVGYQVDGVVRVSIAPQHEADVARADELRDIVRSGLSTVGIANPGETNVVPLGSGGALVHARRNESDGAAGRPVRALDVSAGYFDVLRIPILEGRMFTASDDPTDVVINESLARTLWPNSTAVGRLLHTDGLHRVVGVVADAYLSDINRIQPTLFRQITSASQPVRSMFLLPDDPRVIERVRTLVTSAAPSAVVSVRSLRDDLQLVASPSLIGASIASGIGLAALALAAIGVFGVFSYVVQERTQEIGIRMALGARTSQVLRLIFRQTASPLAGGLLIGLIGSLLVAPVLRAYLIGIGPYDALAFAAAAVVMAAAAGIATFLPARRATSVDPASVLRHE